VRIVEIQLSQLQDRLRERRITLNASAEVKKLLAEAGHDPQFGARPLKRTIQRLVVDPLTARLLAGEVRDGAQVTLAARSGAITINVAAPKAAPAA
ncbi:MAG TPA: ATP-dependent chaperone ClpB, partial [Thermoplasmata archaeon]|nr:ATP-dependent chaperone ClpB [Thermoplasmata archaeon]